MIEVVRSNSIDVVVAGVAFAIAGTINALVVLVCLVAAAALGVVVVPIGAVIGQTWGTGLACPTWPGPSSFD